MENNDMINHPPHYRREDINFECHDITKYLSFDFGNAIKYLWRWESKNGIEDLKKARWYLDHCDIKDVWNERSTLHDRTSTMDRIIQVYKSTRGTWESHIWANIILMRIDNAIKALDNFIDYKESEKQ